MAKLKVIHKDRKFRSKHFNSQEVRRASQHSSGPSNAFGIGRRIGLSYYR
jgi:hypothetical protein